jgi:carbamoyl-phosphate synthase large subunit
MSKDFPVLSVLVTGAGGGVGQGIIKSLNMIHDLHINVIAADMSSLASGLYGGSKSYLVPDANDPAYFDRIEYICDAEDVDYYFPGTDVELLVCAKYASVLLEKLNVKIVVSPLSVIEIADDKFKTVEFLRRHDFDHPKSWLPSQVALAELKYPLIVKPRVGCRSIGVQLVDSQEAAKAAIISTENPVIQEFIDGDEFTCTVAVFKNKISDVLCLRRELRAGDTYRAFPERSEVVEQYVRAVAVKLGVEGSCNFQLRVDKTGVPKIFEINSRFSGTTPFCSYLGFNPVEFCLKADLGGDFASKIDYDKVVLRHWAEVLIDKKKLTELAMNGSGVVSAAAVLVMR